MRFQGKIYKAGKHWIVEAPMFAAMTQGRTRKEALTMIADWFETMADHSGFTIQIHDSGAEDLELGSQDTRTMIRLLLQRQRQKSGLSLAEVASRLGARSRNAYARYERGASVPTVEKLDELLRALAPDRDIVVRESAAA